MEILGKLGIDLHLLIAQIINFVVLLFILNKLVYGPILKEIKEKSEDDRNNKDRLEEKEQEIEKKLAKINSEIKKSKNTASDIILEAEMLAKKIKEKAQKETSEEKAKIISQIKKRSKK